MNIFLENVFTRHIFNNIGYFEVYAELLIYH